MEESKSQRIPQGFRKRYILKFAAATGFMVVLEFIDMKHLEGYRSRIVEAGLKCEQLEKFDVKFDQADLLMDLRSPICAAQFDLEDWL